MKTRAQKNEEGRKNLRRKLKRNITEKRPFVARFSVCDVRNLSQFKI